MARPTLLTAQRQDRIVELLQSGEYPTTVCAEVRISESTYHAWRKRGRDAAELLLHPATEDDQLLVEAWEKQRANEDAKAAGKRHPHPAKDTRPYRDWTERPYLEFLEATERAMALPERDGVLRIRQAGHGGQLVERRTTTAPDGTVTVVERWSAPQWQALMTLMSRRWRDRWAPSATTEVVYGGQDREVDPVDRMLEEVAQMRAERTAKVLPLRGKPTKDVG